MIDIITSAVMMIPNIRNTMSVTKEKIAVPRAEIRRLRLLAHMQLQENGLFRMALFLTFILKQAARAAYYII